MATPPSAITSRFHRRERGDQRVGEILSDSNSELSSIDDDDGNDATATRRVSEISDDDDRVTTTTQRDTKVHQRPAPVQTIKRKNSKWYDSDDDDWERPRVERSKPATSEAHSDPPRPPSTNDTEVKPPATKSVVSPDGAAAPASKAAAENGGKRSSFQRLVDITFNRSPFAAKRKGVDITSPTSSGPDTPRGDASKAPTTDAVARMRSPMSDGVSSVGDPPPVTTERRMTAGAVAANRKMSTDPNADLQSGDVISPQSNRQAVEMSSATRRRSNQVQSPGAVDPYTGNGELVSRRGSEIPTGVGDALSPGQRKVPGAFPGRPGSGVLLEGWLRQKQRRGVKGMKKWNSRYFVLYAKTNEVRYYADVVQSAWGPIPLGEMGSISLRLIQRIGKPGTLKYKGCRLDITCRNSWGTHYADDYVSSDEENNNNNEGDGGARNRSTDKSNSTPKSSRVYSLMADSPQTTQAWFSMLDSLLVRSANSPRVDVAPSSSSSASSKQLKRANSVAGGGSSGGATKMMTRRRSNTLDAETLVMSNPTDNVPKPVLYAINFIFDSTPGIETDRFYTTEPDNQRLKSALKFLNQFATDSTRKPAKDELEATLDALTAGAIVKTWLRQLEQPIVPFEMYEDFHELALEATTAPFELLRNLKALVRALPRRHLAMMACLLFHLNDVSAYASKNGMDACVLASIFGEFILRPRTHNNNEDDAEAMRSIVEKMITHVDAIIDEKETDLLEHM